MIGVRKRRMGCRGGKGRLETSGIALRLVVEVRKRGSKGAKRNGNLVLYRLRYVFLVVGDDPTTFRRVGGGGGSFLALGVGGSGRGTGFVIDDAG